MDGSLWVKSFAPNRFGAPSSNAIGRIFGWRADLRAARIRGNAFCVSTLCGELTIVLPFWRSVLPRALLLRIDLAFEMDLVRAVHEAIEDGVGERRIADVVVPVIEVKLAGHER